MLKALVILFLLAAVIVGAACHSSAPTPNCPFDSWRFYPPGIWECNYSASASNEYDPAKLLNPLLQYKPFADFYDKGVKPYGYTIHYLYNPDLPPGIDAQTTVDTQNHIAWVKLGNITPNDDFAFIVAHELASIGLFANGFPYLKPLKPPCTNLATDLFDMMTTPVRDNILASYGFNVEREFYAHRIPTLFSLACGEGNDTYEQLDIAFYYVQLVSYWEAVLGHSEAPIIINGYVHTCFPNAFNDGQQILSMVANPQTSSTTHPATALFQEIIDKYNLEDCIAVVVP